MRLLLGDRDGDRSTVVLHGESVLLRRDRLPRIEELPVTIRSLPLMCSLRTALVDVVDSPHAWTPHDDMAWLSADAALTSITPAQAPHLIFGLQVGYSTSRLRHCPGCGTPGMPLDPDRVRYACPRCAHVTYPRLDPAVMVLAVRDRQVLLVRAAGRTAHGAVTGFVGPGESAEQACRREVLEETGIVLETLRYVASLSWPGPHSLMLGFVATCAPGTPVPDGSEVCEASFVRLDRLPDLVPAPNLVHTLIADVRGSIVPEGAR